MLTKLLWQISVVVVAAAAAAAAAMPQLSLLFWVCWPEGYETTCMP